MAKETSKKANEVTVEEKLAALYDLQQIDSQIDKIRLLRGELPLEVSDLEDEIAGLEARYNKLKEEQGHFTTEISDKKNQIKDATALIKKYKEQQKNVRNNREYESITKEIEFQGLEIELAEKRIKEFAANIESKKEILAEIEAKKDEREKDLKAKKGELSSIVAETQKEEDALLKKSEKAEKVIEERLLKAYHRLRENMHNGLAVVAIERNACGGCFNSIPPQRSLDVMTHKKIIVCEHCGRILVDEVFKKDKQPAEAEA